MIHNKQLLDFSLPEMNKKVKNISVVEDALVGREKSTRVDSDRNDSSCPFGPH
jgi:hypothetical protein